jgi:hypothetical protein
MVITCSNNKCATISALHPLIGTTYARLVKYLVIVMIYLTPDIFIFDGVLIGPTKSIPIFQIPAESLVVVEASHRFCWVRQPSDIHHIYGHIPWHLYGLLATIIL